MYTCYLTYCLRLVRREAWIQLEEKQDRIHSIGRVTKDLWELQVFFASIINLSDQTWEEDIATRSRSSFYSYLLLVIG